MKLKVLAFCLACVGFASYTSAQNNIAEEVAWVVGDQPIWKSEIEEMYQQMQYERLLQYLADTYHLDFITLDRKEYMNYGQLNTIKDQMELCAGAIVFAFSYLDVESGAIHKNLSSEDMVDKKESSYTSPWIQIEAAFASSLKLPTLVVMGEGVECDGLFDDKIIVNEIPYNVNKAELIKKIAELVNEKKIEGISNVNDESDREGMRIVIDIKRDANANVILAFGRGGDEENPEEAKA